MTQVGVFFTLLCSLFNLFGAGSFLLCTAHRVPVCPVSMCVHVHLCTFAISVCTLLLNSMKRKWKQKVTDNTYLSKITQGGDLMTSTSNKVDLGGIFCKWEASDAQSQGDQLYFLSSVHLQCSVIKMSVATITTRGMLACKHLLICT